VFDGTAPVNTTVTISDNGTVIDTFQQSAVSTSFQQTLNLTPGQHSLVVTASDQSGNTVQSQPLNVTIDLNDLSPDLKYVRALYTQNLNRPGSVPEWSYWAQFLNMPNGRFIVANALSRNTEAWTLVVKGWYSLYIGRAAVGGEEQFWVNLIARGF